MNFDRVQRVAAGAAALGTLPLLALIIRRGVNVPYWDEWEWTDIVYAFHTRTLTFAQLWEPHNEHRIFVGNLLVLGLDALGGWNVVREEVFSLLLLAFTQLVLWFLVRRTVDPARSGAAFAVLSVLLLGLCQEENLRWGYQMPWWVCNAALFVAVWALSDPRRGAAQLAGALVAAIVGSLSSSQGLVIWPAGLVAILAVRTNWGRVGAVWCAAGIATVAIVRYGIVTLPSPDHVGLSRPLLLLGYSLTYYGAPLFRSFGWLWALAGGALAIAGLAGAGIAAARNAPPMRARLLPWLALATYAVLCGPLTGTARAGSGIPLATSSRYTTISSLIWIALVACGFVVVPRLVRPVVLWSLVSLVLALSFAQSFASNRDWQQIAAMLREHREKLALGYADGVQNLYPDSRRTVLLLQKLAEIHDGPFVK